MKSARRRICALATTQTSIDGTEREKERAGKRREYSIEHKLHFRVTRQRERERGGSLNNVAK